MGEDAPLRVARVIARLNVGGPALHVTHLSVELDKRGFGTTLIAGSPGPGEASMDDFARSRGARLETISSLGPEIRPLADLRAFAELVRRLRRLRPEIVHTHTAKAGALGRAAALLVGRRRPIIVHTYHGHVLTGYFGPMVQSAYRFAERVLARVSDCLVGVSQATVDELVDLRVASPERFRVIPLGLDLDAFFAVPPPDPAHPLRRELHVPAGATLCLFAGRLVPIKRIGMLLEAVAQAQRMGADVRLALAGDGPERPALEAQASALGISEHVSFLGYRRDLPALYAACDAAVLTSANEGTPVALIEAAAAGRPAIATAVGGVAEIVGDQSGRLVAADDVHGVAVALVELAGNPDLRRSLGAAARERARGRWTVARLADDVELLYRELLGRSA